MKKIAFLIPSLALAAMPVASAVTVLVDLSTADTIANPEGGLYWNSIGSGTNTTSTITGLVDSTNVATPFNLSITPNSIDSGGVSGAGFGGTGVNGPEGASEPFIGTAATSDGLFSNNDNNGTALFSFTGLAANTSYNFSAIGGRNSNGEDGEIVILSDVADFGTGVATTYDLLNNGTILNFSTDATAGGEIWFEFRSGGGNNGTGATINAFSIEGAVPEPSTALLGGLGLLLLLRRRR